VGYAAVFNKPSHDLGGFREVIKPGAFKRTLADSAHVVALNNHNAIKSWAVSVQAPCDWKKMTPAFDLSLICLIPLMPGIYQPLSNVATWLAVHLPSVSGLVASFGKNATAKPSAR
jgi:hypothetical protein